MPNHFLKLSDFSGETLRYMLERAKVIKSMQKSGVPYEPFRGKVLIMVFEKASTRTRVSFETGFYQLGGNVVHLATEGSQIGRSEPFRGKVLIMVFEKASTRTRVSFETGFYQLGGNVVHLATEGSQIGRSESIPDTARVISRMGDLIMMRTFGQDRLLDMANNSKVPVINGLTNEYHPVQIMADILTFEEHCGPITGKTVAWVGDANNMSYTWIEAAKHLGFNPSVARFSSWSLKRPAPVPA